MRIFATGRGGLQEIRETNFKNEREIQRTVEKNLAAFFPGLEIVQSEWSIKDIRIDTLAFDNKAKAFVIIEYKKGKNSGVIDQAIVYHKKLKQNQNDCVMALMETRSDGKLVRPKEIDWQKTRLILIGSSFTKRQIEASDSEDRLELYEIRKYPDHLTVARVGATDEPSVGPIVPNPEHSEADWLDPKDRGAKPLPEIRDLYFTLKNALIDQFQLQLLQRKRWVSFRLEGTEVCSVVLRKHKLQITYSTVKKDLLPSSDFVKDVSRVGRWGRGNYRSDISTELDVSRAIECVDLVRQDISGLGNIGNKSSTTDPPAYSEADWLDGKYGGPKPTPQIRDLYFVLKSTLIDRFQLEHVQRKRWASFRLEGTEVCSVVVQKFKLRLVYSTFKRDLLPPTDFIHDVSGVGKFGRGHYRSDIETKSDVSHAMQYVALVRQDVSGSGV